MDSKMKKIGIMMNLFMGFSMSLVLSLVGTITGGHFTVASWGISFLISLVISLVIGFIVPIKRLGDAFCGICKTNPHSLKGNLLSSLISDIIYTPLITIVMVTCMLKSAAAHAPEGAVPPVGRVLPGSLIITFVVGYIVICILQPTFLKILMKQTEG